MKHHTIQIGYLFRKWEPKKNYLIFYKLFSKEYRIIFHKAKFTSLLIRLTNYLVADRAYNNNFLNFQKHPTFFRESYKKITLTSWISNMLCMMKSRLLEVTIMSNLTILSDLEKLLWISFLLTTLWSKYLRRMGEIYINLKMTTSINQTPLKCKSQMFACKVIIMMTYFSCLTQCTNLYSGLFPLSRSNQPIVEGKTLTRSNFLVKNQAQRCFMRITVKELWKVRFYSRLNLN